MRISDWSSDVCSSDLQRTPTAADHADQLDTGFANLIGAKVDFAFFVGMTSLFGCRAIFGRGGVLRVVRRLLAAGTSGHQERSEEHTSELQSLMRISYAVFCLKKKKIATNEIKRNN